MIWMYTSRLEQLLRRKQAVWIAVLLCLPFLLKAAYDLMEMLMFEWKGPMDGDAHIYLTMGRGILNGKIPYLDLFESKPPGVFFLMALSVLMTGTERAAAYFVMMFFIALPITFGVWAWRTSRHHGIPSIRIVGTTLAILAGSLLVLRSEQSAAGLQSEIFGGMFAALYVFAVLWNEKEMGRARFALATLGMLGAIGIKEPFIIGLFAAALIFSRTPKDFLRSFIFPLLTAAVAGLVILFLTRTLVPYFEFYLPSMFLRVGGEGDASYPLWIRVLWLSRLFGSLTFFSATPHLGYGVIGAFLWLLAARLRGDSSVERWLLIGAFLVVGHFFTYFVNVLRVVHEVHRAGIDDLRSIPLYVDYVSSAQGYGLFAVLVLGVLAWWNWKLLGLLLYAFAIAFLLSMAIGVGGYGSSYALFTLPAFIALFLLFFRKILSDSVDQPILMAAVSLMLLIATAVFTHLPDDTRNQYLGRNQREYSREIGAILDACGNPPYFIFGGFPEISFAKQSPIGPIFTPNFHTYLGLDHELYRMTHENIRRDAQIFIQFPVEIKGDDPIPTDIRELFSADAPRCADGLTVSNEYDVLFRKKEMGGTLWQAQSQ